MKFFALAALLGSAASMKLTDMHHVNHLNKAPAAATLAQIRSKMMEVPSFDDVEKWVKQEIKKDGSITQEEVKEALEKWEEETGKTIEEEEWDLIEASFGLMDLNDDGKVTKKELKCVFDGKKCPEDDGLLDLHELTEEQWAEVHQMLVEGFEDGELTLKECKKGMKKFEKKHGKVSPDSKAVLLALFHLLDANGDKKVTLAELEAAADKYDVKM